MEIPPRLWQFLAIILLVSTAILHSIHSNTVQSNQNSESQVNLDLIKTFTDKLKAEVEFLKSKAPSSVLPEPSEPSQISQPSKPTLLSESSELFRPKIPADAAFIQVNSAKPLSPVADSPADADDVWSQQVLQKLRCVRSGFGGLFLYHVRKAAGTTIREVLTHVSRPWHVQLFETEGIALDEELLRVQSLLSVTTLRDPVSRVMSLYWYEHVGWFHGILHETDKCKSLRAWVEAWRDGSVWKTEFMKKNPGSLYVEIENYYVKALVNWQGPHPVTREDLDKAKQILQRFDVVLLTEWMQDDTQVSAMNELFPGRSSIAAGYKVKGDKKMKDKLKSRFASDEDEVKKIIQEINVFDSELFDFAQSLLARRLRKLRSMAKQVKGDHRADASVCGKRYGHLAPHLQKHIGVFRPPGHKGPL